MYGWYNCRISTITSYVNIVKYAQLRYMYQYLIWYPQKFGVVFTINPSDSNCTIRIMLLNISVSIYSYIYIYIYLYIVILYCYIAFMMS